MAEQAREIPRGEEATVAASTTKGCPYERCDGSGWVYVDSNTVRECQCKKDWRKRTRIEKLFSVSGIPKRYRDRTLKGFNGERQPAAYKSALRYVERYRELAGENKNGLCLVGPTGTGKSHLAFGIVNELIKQSVAAVVGVVPDLLDSLRPKEGGNAAAEERLEILKTADLVLLDDLGAERGSDWAVERLYLILNARYVEQLPTIITTNVPLENMELDEYGNTMLAWERIVSRIKEMCYVLAVDGEDYRRGMR